MAAPKKVIAVSLVLLAASGVVRRAWAQSSSRGSTKAPSRFRSSDSRASRSEESVQSATRFERVIREFPRWTVVSKTGRAEIATDPMGVELSDCIVILKPRTSGRRRTRAKGADSTHVRALR